MNESPAATVSTSGGEAKPQAFDAISATSSLDALQGLVRDSAEGLHNIMVLRAMVIDADYTIAQLTRALREAIEPPIFMGEPLPAPPATA